MKVLNLFVLAPSGCAVAAVMIAATPVYAANISSPPGVLRVCADSNYLPFSNQAGQGFENKVAEILAKAMGRKLQYYWGSYRDRGGFPEFLAISLDVGKCDVVMNIPYGAGDEGYTDSYYTSSYVFVTKKSAPAITSMRTPALQTLKIGFEDETPPGDALKVVGLTNNVKNIKVFDVASDKNASPRDMLEAVRNGSVGVVITWEPAIGYFLKDYPDLKIASAPAEQMGPGLPAMRFSFAMSIGMREKDKATRDAVNRALKSQKGKIDAVLAQYRVLAPPAKSEPY
jgi:mxaJ protein